MQVFISRASKRRTKILTVRKATLPDAEQILSFQQAMALETEGIVLEESVLREGITQVFHSINKGFYLVAEENHRLVGSLLITYEWSDWRNATFWWIQSVFVAPKWRRKGVYRSLHQHLLQMIESQGDICGIRLYVERSNAVAQQTYKELGMTPSHYDLYEIDFPLQSSS